MKACDAELQTSIIQFYMCFHLAYASFHIILFVHC